jgi:hypothetical protein
MFIALSLEETSAMDDVRLVTEEFSTSVTNNCSRRGTATPSLFTAILQEVEG